MQGLETGKDEPGGKEKTCQHRQPKTRNVQNDEAVSAHTTNVLPLALVTGLPSLVSGGQIGHQFVFIHWMREEGGNVPKLWMIKQRPRSPSRAEPKRE